MNEVLPGVLHWTTHHEASDGRYTRTSPSNPPR